MKVNLLFILLCLISFSISKAQTVIWQEDFSAYADTNTSANDDLPNPPGPPNADGKTDWVRDISGATNIPPGYFYIQNAATDASFEARDTQGEVTWTSQYIDISSFANVYLSMDFQHRLTGTNDTIRAYYRLDNGGEALFGQFVGSGWWNDLTWVSASLSSYSLSADSVQIIIKVDISDESFFGPLTTQIHFDNVTVTEQRDLYSINNGNWNTSGNWSLTTGGGSCGCTPGAGDFVHIENGNTININGNYSIYEIHIYNTGILQWTNSYELGSNGGPITIDTGGSLDRGTYTGDIILEQPGSVSFVVNGSATISNLEYNNNNIIVAVSGNSDFNIDNNLNVLSPGGFSAPYTGEQLINSGNIVISGNIDLRPAGFGGSGNIIIENYGDITLNGTFSDITATSRFENFNNSTWNFGGATFDTDVQLYCDNGLNTFNYNGIGNQNIITPQDSYSNLTFSNSGNKTLLDAITVTNSLTLTAGIVLTDATNILQMNAAATLSGQSNASFVSGPMRYNTVANASITFPVGKAGELHQVDLNVTGISASYTAEYINSSAGGLGYTLPASLERVSAIGYWSIVNGSITVTTADVTLYYNANDFVSDATNLRVAKDDGSGNWLDLGGTGTGDPTGSINSTTNFTDFSEFSLANATGGSNGLPVEWLSFAGRQEGQLVHLVWKTASETNNDYFSIERSEDGISFENIGSIEGSGNTVDTRKYEFYDESPFEGKNYYRIKQTDYDGEFDYSRLILVDFNQSSDNVLIISSNPITGDFVRIRIPKSVADAEMLLQIIDTKGRIIRSEDVLIKDYSFGMSLDRNVMTSGIYIIHLYGLKGVISGRFVIP